jgi:hypothetical protein
MTESTAYPIEQWYIIKANDGHCQVIESVTDPTTHYPNSPRIWGPYASQGEAIARRVGLIRANQCRPQ